MTDFMKSHVFKKMTGFLVTVDILQNRDLRFSENAIHPWKFLNKNNDYKTWKTLRIKYTR